MGGLRGSADSSDAIAARYNRPDAERAMLSNPSHAVVGCRDLAATARFLSAFGFEATARGTLAADVTRALYGLDDSAEEWRLAVPGAATGWLRLVAAGRAGRPASVFDARAFAIDLFTRDVAASVRLAEEAGFAHSKVVEHRLGPAVVREARIQGPDRVILTLLQVSSRQPSLLDAQPDRLHSEVQGFVYSVYDADRCAAFWQETCGLRRATDLRLGGTALSVTLGLAEREIPARSVVFTDAADQPVRVQLLEFLDEGGRLVDDWPLASGLFAVGFEVTDLEAEMRALPAARFGAPVSCVSAALGASRAVTGVAPGAQRFELWQRVG
jgi:catechol 2,3-dioxygenase-like lactoylglutathione lyase family enzyme